MDVRQHAFPGDAEGFRKSEVEWEDFPLVPPPYLTVKNMKTDTGWNPDINAVLQLKVIARVFDACDTIIAATDASREGDAVPPPIPLPRMQAALSPPLDLVTDG